MHSFYVREVSVDMSTDDLQPMITGDTSDGYHTFDELYAYREAYNAALFNEWAAVGKHGVHKSWRHSDGEECFGGGWFIVMAQLPTGQISNHYEAAQWDDFDIPVQARADGWDGHTPADALSRLLAHIRAGHGEDLRRSTGDPDA